MKRKLTLGASYYGTSITRQRGLEIKHYDSLGNPTTRVTLNSETLAFYNANGNKAFYYDSTTGEFKISSSIVVGLDEYEKKAELSTDISTYIDSAAGTAKIVSACSATYATISTTTQITQSVSDVKSEISLSASYGSGTIGSNVRALLQLVSNADTSSIEIKADKINFTGVTTFVRPGDNISTLNNNSGYQTSSGVTTIIGNTVTTDYIEALNIKVKAANITGTLTIGQLPSSVATTSDIPTKVSVLTNDSGYQNQTGVVSIIDGRITADYVEGLSCEFESGKIGGWTIVSNEIWNGSAGINAGSSYTKNSLVTSGSSAVRFYAGDGNRIDGKFVVLDDGSLYAEAAQINGSMTSKGVNDNTVTISNGYISMQQNWTTSLTTSRTASSAFDTWSNGLITLQCGVQNNSIAQAWCGTQSHTIYFSNDNASLSGTWLGTSSIAITSDANRKHDISDMTEAYSILFDKLRPRLYRYDDGTSNRIHVGFVAQEVEAAITAAGLTTNDFAAFVRAKVYNKKTEKIETVYMLRYEEFIALNTEEIKKLKDHMAELEDIVTKLQEG